MAETFLLEIVTPYRKILSREVDELTAPGELGEFGVLSGHTPYITLLKPGELTCKKGSEAVHYAIGRGYAEVSHEQTSILVDSAVQASEIDVQNEKDALAKAEETLKKLSPDDPAYQDAQDACELHQARINLKEKQRG